MLPLWTGFWQKKKKKKGEGEGKGGHHVYIRDPHPLCSMVFLVSFTRSLDEIVRQRIGGKGAAGDAKGEKGEKRKGGHGDRPSTRIHLMLNARRLTAV